MRNFNIRKFLTQIKSRKYIVKLEHCSTNNMDAYIMKNPFKVICFKKPGTRLSTILAMTKCETPTRGTHQRVILGKKQITLIYIYVGIS